MGRRFRWIITGEAAAFQPGPVKQDRSYFDKILAFS
jgi:hypothetical protein